MNTDGFISAFHLHLAQVQVSALVRVPLNYPLTISKTSSNLGIQFSFFVKLTQ